MLVLVHELRGLLVTLLVLYVSPQHLLEIVRGAEHSIGQLAVGSWWPILRIPLQLVTLQLVFKILKVVPLDRELVERLPVLVSGLLALLGRLSLVLKSPSRVAVHALAGLLRLGSFSLEIRKVIHLFLDDHLDDEAADEPVFLEPLLQLGARHVDLA